MRLYYSDRSQTGDFLNKASVIIAVVFGVPSMTALLAIHVPRLIQTPSEPTYIITREDLIATAIGTPKPARKPPAGASAPATLAQAPVPAK